MRKNTYLFINITSIPNPCDIWKLLVSVFNIE